MDFTSPALHFLDTHRQADEPVSDAATAILSGSRPVSVV